VAATVQASMGAVEMDSSAAIGVTAAIAANIDHAASGASALLGFEAARMPFPYGVRAAVMVGPRFESDVIENTTVEFRGSIGFDYGFDQVSEERETHVRTLGLELFIAQVGVSGSDLFGGIALVYGRYENQEPGPMADK